MAYKLQIRRGLLSALPIGISGEPLFATDTNDLYISNGTTNQKFQKFIASGTSSQFLKGDGSLDSTTYVPTTRTLTINGTSYDLSADRSWTISSANIYTADGTLTGNRTVTSGGYTLTFTGNLASNSNVRAKGVNDGTATGASTHIDFITALNYGRVQVYNYTTPALLPLQLSASEVSIGGSPAASTYQLNVQGLDNTLFSHSSDVSIALRSGATTSSQIFFQQSTTNKFSIGYVNATAGLRIYNWGIGSAAGAIFAATNNWSIGSTTDAGYKLDVNGTARVSSNLTATSFIKSGGTSLQYLMADGSVTTGSSLIITNRQTASYTLVLADADKLVEMNVATANNLTVPLNSSVAFAIGTKIDVAQYGAGQTTVVATSGVTVRSAGGALKIVGQYSAATLVKIGTDEWYLIGNITT